jgi:hypothetical protein
LDPLPMDALELPLPLVTLVCGGKMDLQVAFRCSGQNHDVLTSQRPHATEAGDHLGRRRRHRCSKEQGMGVRVGWHDDNSTPPRYADGRRVCAAYEGQQLLTPTQVSVKKKGGIFELHYQPDQVAHVDLAAIPAHTVAPEVFAATCAMRLKMEPTNRRQIC